METIGCLEQQKNTFKRLKRFSMLSKSDDLLHEFEMSCSKCLKTRKATGVVQFLYGPSLHISRMYIDYLMFCATKSICPRF